MVSLRQIGSNRRCHENYFWLEDPSVLTRNTTLFPDEYMTNAERYNAMTRCVIVVSLIMLVARYPGWWIFLLISLVIILVMWNYFRNTEEERKNENRQIFFPPILKERSSRILVPIQRSSEKELPWRIISPDDR